MVVTLNWFISFVEVNECFAYTFAVQLSFVVLLKLVQSDFDLRVAIYGKGV